VVQRLEVHRHDDRHARGHLADVVDAHHDQPALEERGAAGVHHRDARREALDRLLDGLVPDGVAREVEVAEHEAAHRRERLRDLAVAVSGGHAVPRRAVPVEGRLHHADVEAELAEGGLVLRLAEDGDVAREEPLGGVVEVVLVTMCHEHGVEAANDLLGGKRKLDGRVVDRVRGARDRGPRARRIEHRIDENPPAVELQQERRIAHERDAHAPFYGGFASRIRRYTPRSDGQRDARDAHPARSRGLDDRP
jgi:hypothetical protein